MSPPGLGGIGLSIICILTELRNQCCGPAGPTQPGHNASTYIPAYRQAKPHNSVPLVPFRGYPSPPYPKPHAPHPSLSYLLWQSTHPIFAPFAPSRFTSARTILATQHLFLGDSQKFLSTHHHTTNNTPAPPFTTSARANVSFHPRVEAPHRRNEPGAGMTIPRRRLSAFLSTRLIKRAGTHGLPPGRYE
jgi:hypothetical protein